MIDEELTNDEFGLVMNAPFGSLPFRLQKFVVARLASTPARNRQWMLAARDRLICTLADTYFSDLPSRWETATAIVAALERVPKTTRADGWAVARPVTRAEALFHAAAHGAHELSTRQTYNILSGHRD